MFWKVGKWADITYKERTFTKGKPSYSFNKTTYSEPGYQDLGHRQFSIRVPTFRPVLCIHCLYSYGITP